MATTHIIGAGLAGLSAATTLARAGRFVQLYEASGAAGGKVRLLYDSNDNRGYDGCNALLWGSQRHLLEYAASIGSAHSLQLVDSAGQLHQISQNTLYTRRAFLHPPQAPLADIAVLASLFYDNTEEKVSYYFDYYHPLSETYIEPLCKALTHNSSDKTYARTLAARFRRYALAGSKGKLMLMPKDSLYHSLISPALHQIEQEGGAVYFSQMLQGLEWHNNSISSLVFAKHKKHIHPYDTVILAVPASILAQFKLPLPLHATTTSDVVSVIYHTPQASESRYIPCIGGSVDWIKQHHGRTVALSYAAEHLLHMDNAGIARTQWRQIASVLGYDAHDVPEARVLRDRKAITTRRFTQHQHISGNVYCAGESFADVSLLPVDAAIASGKRAAELILSRQ